MRRKVAVLAILAALVLALAGCGQAKDSAGTVDAGGLEAPTAAFLSGAATKTTEATTGKIALTMTMKGLGSADGAATMTATGAYDHAARQAQLTMDMSSLLGAFGSLGGAKTAGGADTSFEEVISDGHLYLKTGAMGKMLGINTPWVEFTGTGDLAKQLTGSSGFSLDPNDANGVGADYLSYLQGVSGTVTEVGTEQVDGVEATHYKADVDVQQLMAKVGDKLGPEAKKRLAGKTGAVSGTIPIEVWIGSDGLVRRLTVSLDGSSLGGASAKGSMNLTVDLTELGQPVQITVPPADQVSPFDLGAKMKGMLSKLGGLTAGSGGN